MIKEINICKCGCGNLCKQTYLKGHGRRSRRNSVEHNKKISESNSGKKRNDDIKQKMREMSLGRKHTEETKIKISKTAKEKGFGLWMIGKKASDETKAKLSKIKMGHTVSEDTRKKISLANSGEKNGFYGKTHSDTYKTILRENISVVRKNVHTPQANEKRRLSVIGKKTSAETKRKMRISIIKFIKNKNGSICPMHNINACKYLDNLSKNKNWDLQHALNGGEFYISELGYFVDGYDLNKNIVVEYDEPLHYDRNGMLKNKDIIRQNEIINHLRCQFFRYNEKKGILYEI